MADATEIAWCDSTFNPWIGCTKIGPGCDNCYAEREFDHRHHRAKWGAGQERSRTSAHNWNLPLRWNKKAFAQCDACGWRGESPFAGLGDACPHCDEELRPVRRRVFCASLADVFDNEVPAQWRADLFALIAKTPNLDWLLLTKRIGNAARMIEAAIGDEYNGYGWPWSNVWIGASIVNQVEADRDIPKLLATPAAVRWVSAEPLLGPVKLWDYIPRLTDFKPSGLNWVVAGGESGPKARPMHPDWVRSLRDQCAAAGVPFLFKQWGEWADFEHTPCDWWNNRTEAERGKLVQCFIDGRAINRCGKKAAGRLLDGVLHNEFPRSAT